MASSSSAPSNGILEGHATNRPPLFDGTNYQFWSTRIAVYIQACDMDMWDVIMEGPFIPTKKNEANEVVPKPKSEWTADDKAKVQINFKAINTLHCALNLAEFNRISTCNNAKEIWDKLKVTHEGTSQVKESKITLLSHQYEMFKMQPGKDITAMFDRFTNIANKLKQLGKEIPENELVKKLLRSLPKSWKPKVIAIKEAKNLNIISLDEVCGSLLTHEQEMKEDEEEKKKESAAKRRSIALKVSSIEDELIHMSDISEDDDELALVAKRFNRLLLKRNPRLGRRSGRRDFNQSWKKKGKDESRNTKPEQVVCYGCKQPGHYKYECPKIKDEKGKRFKEKKYKKAMVATWSDSESSDSNDHESEETDVKANLCLMANDQSSEDEVTSNSDVNISYEELENEHDELIIEYEKLLKTCMKLKQNLVELKDEFTNVQNEKDTLSVKLGKAKTDYSDLMEKHENRAKELDIALGEILSLKKRLEESSKTPLNSNVPKRRNSFKKRFNGYCYCCGKKGHISYDCHHNDNAPKTSMVWVPKGSHVLTNPQGPIKVWVPKCK
ncbi:hypothetical protein REPUB_Repub19eG0134400 [Reevesia pubescens]